MISDNNNTTISGELLASVSILETLPTVQQKVEFADRIIKNIIGLTGYGFCIKGYTPFSPLNKVCIRCKLKDEKKMDEPFDCPLQKTTNNKLIPCSTMESFLGFFIVQGQFTGQMIQHEHHLLNFLTIISTSIDNLLKRHDLEKLNIVLRRGEEKFHSLFTEMSEGFALHEIVYDEAGHPVDYRFQEMNPAFEKILGISKDSIIGKTSREAYSIAEPPYFEIYTRVALTGEPIAFETWFPPMAKHFSISVYSPYKGSFATIFEDITKRKYDELAVRQTTEALTFLAQYSRINQESDFFRLLAEYLAKALDADFVCIDSLEGDGLNARTVAVWCDGAFEDNVVYALKDTPCGVLVGKTVCCFPASVCQFFPNDIVLQDLKAESYVGATLWDHSGNAIGLIAVIKRNQMINQRQAEELLKLVAVRASGEMERIEAEEALRESEQKFKDLFEANTDGITIFRFSPDGPPSTIVAMNENAAKMLGYTREEMLQMNPNELEKNIDNEKIENRKYDLQTKGYSNFETILIHKNGSEINVEIKVSVVEYNNQLALMNIVRNITVRQQAIEALAESEEKFREMANLLPQIVFESDSQGKLSYVNKQAFKTLGYPEDFPIIGLNTLDFYTSESKVRATENIQSRLSGKQKAGSNEYVMVRKDGSTFPALVYSNSVIKNNKPIGLRGIIVDITDRKRVEEEIKKQNEELQKINAEKDKFFSIIAHDLRSPFNSFLGLTKIIAEDLPSLTMADVQKIAVSMSNSATNLYQLLENLLEWSRMKQGVIPFEPEVIEFLPIVEESMALMVEPAKNKEIDLSFGISADITVFADRNMLQTIIRNLVSNALKFTSKGGKVGISAKTTGSKSVEISVTDTGIGMNQIMMDNLFRSDVKTNRKGTEGEPSSGLGLMLCKEFVEKHGGKLWVESEEGKGSVFSFRLPLSSSTN